MTRVEISNRQKLVSVPRAAVRRLARAAARGAWGDRTISIAVVDAAEMIALNQRFTGRDGLTDVLAFAYPGDAAGPDDPAGEVIVCAAVAVREAQARRVEPVHELLLYVAHGLAHLRGLDDSTPAERRRIRACEAALLEEAGLPNVRGCRRPGGASARRTRAARRS